ncbi:MAG: hypothetical protein KAY65_01815 [Planctomycetes bacterium]|nr:hypothetical protein [Planctomycetota bacterium]
MSNGMFVFAVMLFSGVALSRAGVPVEAGRDEFVVVKKVPAVDCRVVRGFLGVPVDGSVYSRDYRGTVREYPRTASDGVVYSYNKNDGLHITLSDGDGFDVIVLRGGAKARVYSDNVSLTEPRGVKPLWKFSGSDICQSARFSKRVRAKKVSFFGVEKDAEKERTISDVSFYRIEKGTPAIGKMELLAPAGEVELKKPRSKFAPHSVYLAMDERYPKQKHRVLQLVEGRGSGSGLKCQKDEAVHFVTRPFDKEKGLDCVVMEAEISGPDGRFSFTGVVQDPLDPRLDLSWVDFNVSGPGRIRIVFDIPDQVILKGCRLWLTLRFDTDVTLSGPKFWLNIVPKKEALPEALARRKMLMKTFFSLLSEPRPWGSFGKRSRDEFFASSTYAGQCPELFMTIDQCHALAPGDDTVRQYREWVYLRNLDKLSELSPPPRPPKGVPAWAWYPRMAWLEVRRIADWWLTERLVPTGEFGGRVGDDSDFYQQFADLPFFETGGVAARMVDSAARMAELADKKNLREGININATDALHAYEEGINHLALMARWFYGDPIYLERCMDSARNMEKLTIVTEDGRRHFRDSERMGLADLTRPRRPRVDGHADPLMWHTALQLADYNRNPRALKILREWADTWLNFMKPGQWATAVEVLTGKVVSSQKDRPLYGGYRTQATTFTWLYALTGDKRYIGPFLHYYRQGKANYPADGYLADVYALGGLDELDRKTLDRLADYNPALALYVKADFDALATAAIGRARSSSQHIGTLYDARRWPDMYTTTHQFTDRIFPNLLGHASVAYLGGFCRRNKFNPTLAVSWEGFGTDYAAIVHLNRQDCLRAVVYSFADKPMLGELRVWALQHGVYRVTIAREAGSDGFRDIVNPDGPPIRELAKGDAIKLILGPKALTVIEIEQIKKLAPIFGRADLAIAAREVRIEANTLTATAHNLGSAEVPDVVAAVVDADGRTIVRKSLGKLAGPLDLVPKRLGFTLELPRKASKGWTLMLDPQRRVAEIYEGNNTVVLDTLGAVDYSGAANR